MQDEHTRAAELRRAQPLAVWRLERTRRTDPLPCELVRAAILHYTDPGELVLAPKLRGGELLQTAAALGRRALPLAPSATSTGVDGSIVPLRADTCAALVLAPLGADASERRLARVAARLLPLLRPGGFLALARGTRATRSDPLGAAVRACQENGLHYWQHVVALTAELTDGNASATRTSPERASAAAVVQARRHHRDLLVFRRPAQAEQAAARVAAAVAA